MGKTANTTSSEITTSDSNPYFGTTHDSFLFLEKKPVIDSGIKENTALEDGPGPEMEHDPFAGSGFEFESGFEVGEREMGGLEKPTPGGAPEAGDRGAMTEGLGMARSDTGDTGDTGGQENPEEAARRMSEEAFEEAQQQEQNGGDPDHVSHLYETSAEFLSDAEAMKNNQPTKYFPPEYYAAQSQPKPAPKEDDDERPAPDDAGSGGGPVDEDAEIPERGDIDWGDTFDFSGVPSEEDRSALGFNPSVDPVEEGEYSGGPKEMPEQEDLANPSVDPVDDFLF